MEEDIISGVAFKDSVNGVMYRPRARGGCSSDVISSMKGVDI